MKEHLSILLTCFNRKNKTLRCLRSLGKQDCIYFDKISIYLVDDNSKDGTVDAVKLEFPHVNIIHGTGDLYWTRGMQLAWEHAEKENPDFYLWLNDDVEIYNYCLSELVSCSNEYSHKAIISGVIESFDKSTIIYGGYTANKKIITPNNKMCNIHNLNGNVVLIPRFVYEINGKFDNRFHHDIGDVDYGLRAINNKIKVLTTKVPVGIGEKNPINRLRKSNTTIVKRFNALYSPLGANPNILFYFNQKHYSTFRAVVFYLYLIFINVLSDSLYGIVDRARKSK